MAAVVVVALGAPFSLLLSIIVIPPVYLLQKNYLAISSKLRTMQMAALAPVLGTLSSSIDGRLTLRTFNLNDKMTQHMSNRIYHAHRPGYLYFSLQSWLTLNLDVGNTLIITTVTALLVASREEANIGWSSIALVNAIGLTQIIKFVIHNWVQFEVSMGSITRILSYIRNTTMEQLNILSADPLPSWPSLGNVELNSLSLAYGWVFIYFCEAPASKNCR